MGCLFYQQATPSGVSGGADKTLNSVFHFKPERAGKNCLAVLPIAALLWCIDARGATTTNHPYRGLTHITRIESSPRTNTIHILLVDLAAPGIRFLLTPPSGTRDSLRQTTLEFLEQEQAQAAINAHFFLPFPSVETNVDLVGLAVSQGVVYSPFEGQPIGTGYVDQSYAILPFAPALNLDRSNQACIVHWDPAFLDHRHVLEPATLWTTVAGSAQIISNGRKTIPTYSGPPEGLTPMIGFSNEHSWYDLRRPRTAIGLSADDGTLVLFTVTGADDNDGLPLGEVAEVLVRDYHIHNALNLDGGGSTTLALRNPLTGRGEVLNASSDNSPGRPVGSNLAIFAEPLPLLAPKSKLDENQTAR